MYRPRAVWTKPCRPCLAQRITGRHRATLTGLCLAGSGPHGTAPTQHALRLCHHVDPKDGKATRVGFVVSKDGKKQRVAKRSGETFNA